MSPAGDLASKRSGAIMGLLKRLNRKHNQTIIMVTRNAGACQQAHPIIRMRDGHIESDT